MHGGFKRTVFRLKLKWCGLEFVSTMSFGLLGIDPLVRLHKYDQEFRFKPVQCGLPRLERRVVDQSPLAWNEMHFTRLRRQKAPLIAKSPREQAFTQLIQRKQRGGMSPRVMRQEMRVCEDLNALFSTGAFKDMRDYYSEPNRTCPSEQALVRLLAAQFDDPMRLLETSVDVGPLPVPFVDLTVEEFGSRSPQYMQDTFDADYLKAVRDFAGGWESHNNDDDDDTVEEY